MCRTVEKVFTLAPRFANSNAIPSPIPLEEPVTMATFPARELDMFWGANVGMERTGREVQALYVLMPEPCPRLSV